MFHVFLQQVEKGCDRCYSPLRWVRADSDTQQRAVLSGDTQRAVPRARATADVMMIHRRWIVKFDIGFATLYALCYGEGVSGTEKDEGGGEVLGGGEGLWLSRGAPPISKQGHPPISRGDADQNEPFLASPLHPRTFHSMHLWRLKPLLDLIFFGRIRLAIKIETLPKNLCTLYLPWNREIWRGNTTRKLCCYLQSSMNEHNIKVLVVCIGILAAVGDINAR